LLKTQTRKNGAGSKFLQISNIIFAASFYLVSLGLFSRGRDSSVGTATRYGLEGPGIESRWGRDFQHPSRQALVPTQPPVQWVPGHSRG
jgi:hypothetical protein